MTLFLVEIRQLTAQLEASVAQVEHQVKEEVRLKSYASELEAKLAEFDSINQDMNFKLNNVLAEMTQISHCKSQLDDSNSMLLTEIDTKTVENSTLSIDLEKTKGNDRNIEHLSQNFYARIFLAGLHV